MEIKAASAAFIVQKSSKIKALSCPFYNHSAEYTNNYKGSG